MQVKLAKLQCCLVSSSCPSDQCEETPMCQRTLSLHCAANCHSRCSEWALCCFQEFCVGAGEPPFLLSFVIRLCRHAYVLWRRRVTVLPWQCNTSGIGKARIPVNTLDDTELTSPPLSAPEIVCWISGAAVRSSEWWLSDAHRFTVLDFLHRSHPLSIGKASSSQLSSFFPGNLWHLSLSAACPPGRI